MRMLKAFARLTLGASVLAVMEVPHDSISSYGAIDAEPVSHNGTNDRLYHHWQTAPNAGWSSEGSL